MIHTYHAWPLQIHENWLINVVKTRVIASVFMALIN